MALEKEFQYFKTNQVDLVSRYNGKFIAIVAEEIMGVFDNELEAYTEMKKKYKVGTFLIQHCLPGENSFSQTFHSRVA